MIYEPRDSGHAKLREVLKKFTALNMPIEATLELTYRCNLKCIHCYVDCKDLPDELTFDEWRDVLDQLKAAGFIYLLFTGGEIMVRPDFLDIASYARSCGFFIEQLYFGYSGDCPGYRRTQTYLYRYQSVRCQCEHS